MVRKKKSSLSAYLAEAKQNFNMTDGLLWALIYVFILTFICYPGLASDSTIRFLEDLTNYDSWHIIFI